MAKLTKNMKNALAKLEKGKVYPVGEAAALVKEVKCTKCDSSVNLAVRLGVDPRKANQMVRGVLLVTISRPTTSSDLITGPALSPQPTRLVVVGLEPIPCRSYVSFWVLILPMPL